MRFSFALITTMMVASVLGAQPAPSSAPPALKVVQSVDKKKGQIVFWDQVTRPVQVNVVKFVIMNGQQVAVTETQTRMVVTKVLVAVDAAKSRIITPAGKQLPIDEVWKRLKANTVVAVSTDGQVPAQVFLNALNAETLVFIAPQAVTPAVPPPQREPLPPPKKD